jgi:WD40 repeat protein
MRVITASEDKTARVWDAVKGEPITAPLEHQDIVLTAMFSADGTRVVTASKDRTARVWDASTGKPVCAPLRHRNVVRSATFSRDGTRVLTASEDNTAQVWTLAINSRSLADWELLVDCSPFTLSNGALIVNPSPLTQCSAIEAGPMR